MQCSSSQQIPSDVLSILTTAESDIVLLCKGGVEDLGKLATSTRKPLPSTTKEIVSEPLSAL